MPKIEILVGMIASGKSTYARQRADAGAMVISHDDLTRMLHARYRYEQTLRDCYRKMEEAIARVAIVAGQDVVIDRTHLTRESRERWIRFTRFPSFAEWNLPAIEAVAFPVVEPEEHAYRRFKADSRGRTYGEWLVVAQHHYVQALAEPISLDEGFSAIREASRP